MCIHFFYIYNLSWWCFVCGVSALCTMVRSVSYSVNLCSFYSCGFVGCNFTFRGSLTVQLGGWRGREIKRKDGGRLYCERWFETCAIFVPAFMLWAATGLVMVARGMREVPMSCCSGMDGTPPLAPVGVSLVTCVWAYPAHVVCLCTTAPSPPSAYPVPLPL